MTEFQSTYVNLLRRQVNEEIAYLTNNGHSSGTILTPCIFCIEQKPDKYICYRLNELKRFQSSLISHDKTNLQIETSRKRIGYLVSSEPDRENVLGTFDLSLQPEDLTPTFTVL